MRITDLDSFLVNAENFIFVEKFETNLLFRPDVTKIEAGDSQPPTKVIIHAYVKVIDRSYGICVINSVASRAVVGWIRKIRTPSPRLTRTRYSIFSSAAEPDPHGAGIIIPNPSKNERADK